MKILVTGTEGYLGAPRAGSHGTRIEVTGVDTGYYKRGYLYNAKGNVPTTSSKTSVT